VRGAAYFIDRVDRKSMKRVLVYSHDTYGLGNLRRMLTVCRYLTETISDLMVLLISGSPMIQSFRLPDRVDYIKLPCLTRIEREEYTVKTLDLELSEAVRLRSELILAAAANYRPDLLLVDKKPFGIKNELEAALTYIREKLPDTRQVLVLRDILDAPESTRMVWEKHRYHDVVRTFYDLVLVLGVPEVFDPRREYRFPDAVAKKVHFCGYIRPQDNQRSMVGVRLELGLADQDKLVLVTSGGGNDGYALLSAYLEGLVHVPASRQFHSLIVCGPEMIESQRREISQAAGEHSRVKTLEFTGDLISYMGAADVILSMGGYNTVCEIMSLKKRAVIVPRVMPVREQLVRAERLGRRGMFKYIHPDQLTPVQLISMLLEELNQSHDHTTDDLLFNLDARLEIVKKVSALLFNPEKRDYPLRGKGESVDVQK
jgi:predicted glycosyltransferase